MTTTDIEMSVSERSVIPASHTALGLAALPAKARNLVTRMFTDAHLLEPQDRQDLVRYLRVARAANPQSSNLRVVLGMALCVNYQVPEAIDELEEGARLAPESFIAHLKLGELWMRLRVCEKAEKHTRQAGLLAGNPLQADLARKQAATLRTLVHNGIERGGYTLKGPWHLVTVIRKIWKRHKEKAESLAVEHTF